VNDGDRAEDGSPSSLPGYSPDVRSEILRVGQPLADDSRNAAPKEHEQFGSMTSIQAECLALSKRKQAHRQRRLAIDPNQGFCPNELASRPE
jgi:hypothetical protein